MTSNLSVELFKEYFLLSNLSQALPWTFLISQRLGGESTLSTSNIDHIVSSTINQLQGIGLDEEPFGALLRADVEKSAAGQSRSDELDTLLREYHDGLLKRISDLPNNPDKAYDALRGLILSGILLSDQIYDAMVLLDNEVSPARIEEVVRKWKEEARGQQSVESALTADAYSRIFWVSRDSHDTIDAISRYRFRDHFGFGEFQGAFDEVESLFSQALLEGSSGMEARMSAYWGDLEFRRVAYDLWLVSRSATLTNRIREFVNITLKRTSYAQLPNGGFTDYHRSEDLGRDAESGRKRSRLLPDTETTALCSLNLLKLAISESLKRDGVRGAAWLLEHQNPDGSWTSQSRRRTGSDPNQDLFVTVLSLEAISRSGIPGVRNSINHGIEWIGKQQNEVGLWDDDVLPFPFLTTLILEFLKYNAQYPIKMDRYLLMSKGFLNRSVQLSLEDNPNSHRLSLIAAHQGIEAFLYSVLSHPSVNKKIFKTASETIGMRKALTDFQTFLQDRGELARDQVIPFRNSLDSLAHNRDEIVHKGVDITAETCRELTTDAWRFCRRYSQYIFGYDAWA